MTINVLGTGYKIKFKADAKGNDAIIDFTSKTIYVADISKDNGYEWDDLEVHLKRTLRHELVHAFFHESGICNNSEWGRDETLVDWIALQFPKMLKAFEEARAL